MGFEAFENVHGYTDRSVYALCDASLKGTFLNIMRLKALAVAFHSQKRTLLLYQVGILLLIWLYVVALHTTNDGLWYQGDAPRHAANGLFWKDFIASFPDNPFDFAVSYYLRYPVITPSAYPPGFYLLEAAAFSLLG